MHRVCHQIDLATPKADLCGHDWCHKNSLVDPDWQCFHKKEMATLERVSSIETEVAELLSVVSGKALEEIKANSKMAWDDIDIKYHINLYDK